MEVAREVAPRRTRKKQRGAAPQGGLGGGVGNESCGLWGMNGKTATDKMQTAKSCWAL
jgi:hypothetical protein